MLKENERLKKEMETFINKEKHRQQVELLKEQNRISEERMVYLKDMERKLKQVVIDWRRAESTENKKELIPQMQALLFKQKEKQSAEKVKKKISSKYQETGGDVVPGVKVLMTKNHKVGEVREVRGRKAIVQLGILPITVDLSYLIGIVSINDAVRETIEAQEETISSLKDYLHANL